PAWLSIEAAMYISRITRPTEFVKCPVVRSAQLQEPESPDSVVMADRQLLPRSTFQPTSRLMPPAISISLITSIIAFVRSILRALSQQLQVRRLQTTREATAETEVPLHPPNSRKSLVSPSTPPATSISPTRAMIVCARLMQRRALSAR